MFERFSEMGIDLGTANTLNYQGRYSGAEPSVVAIDSQTKDVLAV